MVHGVPIAEVALRAGETKPLVLGFTRVDGHGQLKVDRAQIRALTKVAGKARGDARPGIRIRPPDARRRGGGRWAEWRRRARTQYCLAAKAGPPTQCHNGVIVAATV